MRLPVPKHTDGQREHAVSPLWVKQRVGAYFKSGAGWLSEARPQHRRIHQNCTTLFSVVNAVPLRPLPYPEAERLVSPVNVAKGNFMGLNVADFQYAAWRDHAAIFDGIEGIQTPAFPHDRER